MGMLVGMFVLLAVVRGFVVVRGLSRCRLGVVLEGIGTRTQLFTFQAHSTRRANFDFGATTPDCALSPTAPCGRGIPHLMVRGFADRVKPACQGICRGGPGKERHKWVRGSGATVRPSRFESDLWPLRCS